MARNAVTVTLPPFHGMTRRLVLTVLAMFFGLIVMRLVSVPTADLISDLLALHPDQVVRGTVWQLFSYPFVNFGVSPGDLLSILLACLSIWFFGAVLEEERGGRWLLEFFLATTAGGGILTCLASYTIFRNNHHGLEPTSGTYGIWPGILALLLAYAYFHPDQELSFNFLFRVKAKYLAAVYLLIYLTMAFTNMAPMHAVNAICAALAAFAFVRLSPRLGFRHAVSERWYGMRNAYYARKRKRAAKKFTVYMKQQGRDVNIDSEGKYIPLDRERHERNSRRDPNDRRWMN